MIDKVLKDNYKKGTKNLKNYSLAKFINGATIFKEMSERSL